MKKNSLFAAVMLAGLCAGAQQSSQPKSNEQPAQPQSASRPTQPLTDNAAQPPADKGPGALPSHSKQIRHGR